MEIIDITFKDKRRMSKKETKNNGLILICLNFIKLIIILQLIKKVQIEHGRFQGDNY